MKTKSCPGCGGTGIRYQIEAQLGGDLLKEKPIGTLSMQVTCPTCGGSGQVPEAA